MAETGVSLLTLRTEFYARGFDWLAAEADGPARADRWINQAYQSVCLKEPWPFRLTTATGAAPLAIADLGQIARNGVTIPSNNGWIREEATEVEATPLLGYAISSTFPWLYYLDNQTVKTWPVTTASVSVRYYKIPAKLVNDGDLTIVPERFMDVIIDDAVVRGGKDRMAPEVIAIARQERDAGLVDMREALIVPERHIRRVAVHEDA